MNERASTLPKPIYLDYHATTPTDPRVASIVLRHMTEEFGNPSSIDHVFGDEAENAVFQATKQVSQLIGSLPKEVIFTSGATESINLVLQNSVLTGKIFKVAILPTEHKAVLDTCTVLSKKGLAEITFLKVDSQAQLDLDHLDKICSEGIDLLSVMAANNEVGTIYPIQQVGEIAQQYGIPFLCDGSQAVGKIPINFEEWGITFLAISGHKFYAPKGVGALVIKQGQRLEPLMYGGGHQRGIRPGTLNVPGIVGLGEACCLRSLEMTEDEVRISCLRDRLQTLLQEGIPNLVVNGDVDNRLAGNLHISIPGIPNSAVIARVRHQLAISTGSACSSGVEAPSHVLTAMNLSPEVIEGALRIGLGKFTTDQEVDRAAEILISAVHQILKALHSS
ncbi:cysteine desulfurase family protein [Thermostichus vulcanus]|uniref:Cysteine desulfurase n=1 Tax=Thermostichus vulcanus str. 'Rupite' TaxID=2813851 RepID=A0ABT0CCW7_THEVL|nr:cysteine desulfurase family protein [Thermostichus vulcanus]MCJ2543569.1 cysteine desulfurase [Thermostichus vulcanus str. 'Rupite']